MKKAKKKTAKKTNRSAAEKLKARIAQLESELMDCQETCRAIQAGEVDAIMVSAREGERVYTLEGAEHPYRVAIETMNEGAATLSYEGVVLYCNNRFAEILTLPMEKVVGQNLDRFLKGKQRFEFGRMLKAGRRKIIRQELVFNSANGAEVPVLTSLTAIKDSVKGICMVMMDITELKEAQNALKQANELLEERVAERTASLKESEAELQQINEELSTTNEELQTANDELRTAQAAMQQSEEHFRAVAEAMPQLAWVAKADGWIYWYNRGWYEYTGKTPKEMEGWGWQSVHDPKLLPEVLEKWKACVATGKPFEMVFPLRGADGKYRLFLTRGHPLKDAKGRVVKWFGTNTDVEELKRAEEALRQSEEQFRQLAESAPYAIFIQAQKRIAYINKAGVKLFGAEKADELIGRPVLEMIHPDYRSVVEERIRSTNENGKGVPVLQEKYIRLDGSVFDSEVSVAPFVYRGQKGGLVFVSDITKRKADEESLRQSEERFRTMSEAVPGIVWTAQADGRIDYVNKRWYEYTGLPAAEALGIAWENNMYPDDRQATREAWARSVKTGAGYKIQHRIRRADGEYRWHLTQAVPLHDSEGNTVKWFGTSTDIEEQMRNQQELERFRDELEHKNEELESIIRIASHDLRSPLTNIKGFSGELSRDLNKVYELLGTVPLPEEVSGKVDTVFNKYVKEAIGFIQTSADSINSMLKNLMQVAKAGTVPINIENLNMNELLAKMAGNIQFRLKETGGQFEMQELPRCRGDQQQLLQVITNLIDNAIKYREPSRPLQIRIYGTSGEGMATYCVEDNGKGIEPQYLDKIFELFARLEPETAKGEGLGLTIAKRMIERQGGKIWANSQPGKGSKFFISLPY